MNLVSCVSKKKPSFLKTLNLQGEDIVSAQRAVNSECDFRICMKKRWQLLDKNPVGSLPSTQHSEKLVSRWMVGQDRAVS